MHNFSRASPPNPPLRAKPLNPTRSIAPRPPYTLAYARDKMVPPQLLTASAVSGWC